MSRIRRNSGPLIFETFQEFEDYCLRHCTARGRAVPAPAPAPSRPAKPPRAAPAPTPPAAPTRTPAAASTSGGGLRFMPREAESEGSGTGAGFLSRTFGRSTERQPTAPRKPREYSAPVDPAREVSYNQADLIMRSLGGIGAVCPHLQAQHGQLSRPEALKMLGVTTAAQAHAILNEMQAAGVIAGKTGTGKFVNDDPAVRDAAMEIAARHGMTCPP